MAKSIKNIKENNTIVFSEKIKNVFDLKKLCVTGINKYLYEDSEVFIIESDEFMILNYNLDNEDKYFLYEKIVSGDINEVEQEGCYFLNEDLDFKNKIVNRDDAKPQVYKHSEIGCLFGLTDEENCNCEISLCEYICHSSIMKNMLVIKKEKEGLILVQVYHGFEINKNDIKVR